MRVITLEEHIEFPDITAAIAQSSGQAPVPKLSEGMRHYMATELPDPATMQDVTGPRLAYMDAQGIAMQVLSFGNAQPQNLPVAQAIALCQQANDDLAAVVAAHPDRFAALAVLPVADPQAAAKELHRAVEEKGLRGVLLKGNFGGKLFDDPFFFPIFQAASNLGVPVYFHPSFIPGEITSHYFASDQWSDVVTGILSSAGYGWHMDVGVQVLRMVASGIFDKLPNLKLISGHWGELVPLFLERLDDEFTPHAGLRKAFSDYYREHVWVTPSGMLTRPQLRFLLDEMGEDHLMMACDYPYKQPQNVQAFLAAGDLTPAQQEKFAFGNAEKLLHLK
ncbi:amidohydrolase family protein [Lacticaseibacillus mingshuiensis]|uniref:Amidohydrolase family protein n=1 Tax=Lacticaseibacillus mingshuiensis TaxID=2799574 RepID=A0ABW4CJG0_9LACO|nr:amidohydrolase family protein [Lacticaseibacillus mingshuiensis]